MFYLIDEKDGLDSVHGSILVNAQLLKIIDSTMNKGFSKLNISFYFSKTEGKRFTLNKDSGFNVNSTIKKLSELKFEQYNNPLIVLQDIENIQNLKEKQFYLHKFSNILVNLHSIYLVYKNDKQGSIILTPTKNVLIKETPEEVFQLINSRILK